MSTAYTSLLGLALPATGELSGTWGDTVNNYITTYLDSSIAGSLAVSLTGDVTLTKTTNSGLGSTSSQYAVLNVTPNASTWTITAPAASKIYVVNNLSGTYTFTFKASGQTGVTIAVSEKCVVAFNGTDFVKIASTIVSASGLTGVVPIANGGTNQSSAPTQGGVSYGTATAFAFTAAGTAGQALISNATSAPAFGTLGVAGGGTNATATPTAGGISYGTGTAYAFTGVGTSGQALISNAASAPAFGTLGIAGGGTNAVATPTAGGISYGTGSAYAFSGVGTAGQALLSNAASAPSFGTLGIPAGGTGQTSAASALSALGGIGTGKSIAMAMIFGF